MLNLSDIKLSIDISSLCLEDISDEVYFSSKYKKYISNSALNLINPEQGGSEEKFIQGLKPTLSSSLSIGDAVHKKILQTNDYVLSEPLDKPTAKAGVMADLLYPEYLKYKDVYKIPKETLKEVSLKADYYANKLTDKVIDKLLEKLVIYYNNLDTIEQSDNLIILDNKSLNIAKNCIAAINNNNRIVTLLQEDYSVNEYAITINFKAEYNNNTILLPFKGKIDNFTFSDITNTLVLNDLKTTSHTVSQFKESFNKYCYYRQMAVYTYLLKAVATNILKFNLEDIKVNMLVVSTTDFTTSVYPVSYSEISKGFKQFTMLMKMVASLIFENKYSLC